jgi:hypothetical protein
MGPWEHTFPSQSKFGAPLDIMDDISLFIRNYKNKSIYPYSCKIFMLDFSCSKGAWYTSKKYIKPIKHELQSKINIIISVQKEIFSNVIYYSISDCKKRKEITIPNIEINIPTKIKNICGLINISISDISRNTQPFMIYILIKRNSEYHLISSCVYNPKLDICQAKPFGCLIKSNDKIVLAFDLNTFPYIWNVFNKNDKVELNGTIKIFFSEYRDLIKSGVYKLELHPKSQTYNFDKNKIIFKNNDKIETEIMELKKYNNNIIMKHYVKYKGVKSKTIMIGNGKKFRYVSKILAGKKKIILKDKFKKN